MNKKTAITGIIISVILNIVFGGLLIGGGLLVLELPKIFDTVLSVAFALIGISLTLTTIPNLIGGIASFKQKKGNFDLVFSIITMVIGVTLAIYGVITALIAFGVEGVGVPGFVSIIMTVLRWTICGLIALYLIVLPIIRICKAEKKMLQFKAELIKMILGVLIVVLLICGLLTSVLNDMIGISLIVVGALTVILAIINLIVGLVGISKAPKQPASVAVAIDTDGDGKADAIVVDTDGDGKADAVGIDVDGDGTVDVIGVDTDGDGKVDAVVAKDE